MADNLATALDAATLYLSKTSTVRVTEDIPFGIAGVGYAPDTGATQYRPLLLDIYEPAEKATGLRPALIMAFGGAFHRGTRKNDIVEEGEHRNTAIAEYCREFARRGYVCFSIDYRLMQEAPDPGVTPTIAPGTPMNVDRVNYVRNLLGFAPCTQQMMIDEIEATTDDMSQAVTYVRSRSFALGIDPDRIAVGGFSAGAIMAMNAAFAERAPVAAVVALSGRMSMGAARAYVTGAKSEPAILMFVGENDLPAMLDNLDGPIQHMASMGLPHQLVRIAGATHFYPRTATTIESNGTSTDVESMMASFLYNHLRLIDL